METYSNHDYNGDTDNGLQLLRNEHKGFAVAVHMVSDACVTDYDNYRRRISAEI